MQPEQSITILPTLKGVVFTHLSQSVISSSTIIVLALIAYIVLRSFINVKIKDLSKRHYWRRRSFYLVVILALVMLFKVWIEGFDQILTIVSIVAGALIVIQKEFFTAPVGFLLIKTHHLFEVGDRIEIEGKYGKVLKIGVLYFELLDCKNKLCGDQTTGSILKIPTGKVLMHTVTNNTELFNNSWQEITINLKVNEKWKELAEYMLVLINKESSRYVDLSLELLEKYNESNHPVEQNFSSRYYINIVPETNNLLLTIRYLCPSVEQRTVEHNVWSQLLPYLANEGIEMANQGYDVSVLNS
jgi:hypothetical protein